MGESHYSISTLSDKLIERLEEINALLGKPPQPEYWETILEKYNDGRVLAFICTMTEAPNSVSDVGYVIYNRSPKYALFKKLGIPEVQDLNVLPAFRRQGIGKALVEKCEAQAIDDHFDMIGIGVGLHSGFGSAQRLYARLGYIPDGTGVTYDRKQVAGGEFRPIDDNLSLMMLKNLKLK